MVRPCPRVPWASTVPPAELITCFTIARPSPVPREARARRPVEALEEARHVLGEDYDAVVGGDERHAAVLVAQAQGQWAPGPA